MRVSQYFQFAFWLRSRCGETKLTKLHRQIINAGIQTFFIFFGVAIGVGIAFGLALHLLVRVSTRVFGLDRPTPPKDRAAKGHSASSYRAAREKKRLDEELRKAVRAQVRATEPLLGQAGKAKEPRRPQASPLSPTSPRPRSGLLSTTILEEVDDSDGSYGF